MAAEYADFAYNGAVSHQGDQGPVVGYRPAPTNTSDQALDKMVYSWLSEAFFQQLSKTLHQHQFFVLNQTQSKLQRRNGG